MINWKKESLVCFARTLGEVREVLVDYKGNLKFYVNKKVAEKRAVELGGIVQKCGSKFLIIKNGTL
jgi:hypothetical protein